MLLNCGVGENSGDSWTARRSNQSILRKSILNIHWKDWCGSWNSNTLATWCKELTHWERPWCWERLKAGEGSDRGWDGWMASPTWWAWVWTSSGSWWWTGRPAVLQSVGSQRFNHNWATEQINLSKPFGQLNTWSIISYIYVDTRWSCIFSSQSSILLKTESRYSGYWEMESIVAAALF